MKIETTMKKLFITLALVAFAMTANAQFVLGGHIGLAHNGSHDDNYTLGSNASTDITVMPKIGYQLNDKMQLGVQLGLEYNYNRAYAGNEDTYLSTYGSVIRFNPYFRYNVAEWRNFTLFCEAQVSLGLHLESHTYNTVTDNTTDNNDDFTTVGLSVVPGLNYSLSEKCSLDLYINLVRLACDWTLTDGVDTHSYYLGADMNAQSINAQFGNFLVGFNYHF